MTKKIKTGLLIVAFIGAIIMILFVDYSVRGTATRDGYYKPHTVYFNRDNGFSLWNPCMITAMSSIDFTSFSVKSLYPHAKVMINAGDNMMRSYVWKLKLLDRNSNNKKRLIHELQPIDLHYSNYPLPQDILFYEIPDYPNLILGLDNSKYAHLLQIINNEDTR